MNEENRQAQPEQAAGQSEKPAGKPEQPERKQQQRRQPPRRRPPAKKKAQPQPQPHPEAKAEKQREETPKPKPAEPAKAAAAPPEKQEKPERAPKRGGYRRGQRRRGGARKPEASKPAPPEEPQAPPVVKRLAVGVYENETRVAVLENGELTEIYVARKGKRSIVGDIYMSKVENVLPGMGAAFVEIGHARNALLYVGDIFQPDAGKGRKEMKITKILKSGQPIMVQVTKDPMGAKGARVTGYVSLAGRYVVLLPQLETFGVSQKLEPAERERLRSLVGKMKPANMGVIVRTASAGAQEKELEKDIAYLMKLWKGIQKDGNRVTAPASLYREVDLEIKVVRDVFNEEFKDCITDSRSAFRNIRNYLKKVAPDLVDKVQLYQGKDRLYDSLEINRQIGEALKRSVGLPSGGSIVIDDTEALTAIDVNTGRYVGRSNLEKTVLKTNVEAAREIVRQIRLRDIGGLIVIDFIDMNEIKNRQEVLDTLMRELEKDRTKSHVVEISKLGLVEMTRKNVSEGLIETFGDPCPHCGGRGVLLREP